MNNEAKTLVAIGIGTILLLVGGATLFSRFTPQNERAQEEAPVDSSLLLPDGATFKGNPDAKVVVAEFADFQCPACAQSAPVVKKIVEEYKDRVKFVFRHFPLDNHKNAIPASRAVESAGVLGKYWEMHDLLYDKQADWSEESDFSRKAFEYAKQIGLDEAEFKKLYESGQFDEKINKGRTDGIAAGVTATPTFFVNGIRYVGVLSEARWREILDNETSRFTEVASPSASPSN